MDSCKGEREISQERLKACPDTDVCTIWSGCCSLCQQEISKEQLERFPITDICGVCWGKIQRALVLERQKENEEYCGVKRCKCNRIIPREQLEHSPKTQMCKECSEAPYVQEEPGWLGREKEHKARHALAGRAHSTEFSKWDPRVQ